MAQQTLYDINGARILFDRASNDEAGVGVEIFTPLTKLIDATPGTLRPTGIQANPLYTRTENKKAFLDLIGVSRKRAKIFKGS